MCLRPEPIGEIPPETVRVARAAFPKGTVVTRLRDEFSDLYRITEKSGGSRRGGVWAYPSVWMGDRRMGIGGGWHTTTSALNNSQAADLVRKKRRPRPPEQADLLRPRLVEMIDGRHGLV